MFIHDRLGRRKDATGAIVDLIRVASSSGMGSTHLIGHELGHNLMSIARDAGVITEAQQKELDALFTDKNGKFDEEAFAEAFARELKRAFFETVQKRMEDVPSTKAGRALRRVADFVVTLARSFAFWRQERGLDPVTGQPLQSGQVLDAFLKRERTAVDEATQVANAARAAEARATQEAMANAPTQTVVDEDGTEVAYHISGLFTSGPVAYWRPSLAHVGSNSGRQYSGWGLYSASWREGALVYMPREGGALMVQTWWTHRPAGDESHLLVDGEPLSAENRERVAETLAHLMVEYGVTMREMDEKMWRGWDDANQTGDMAYRTVEWFFKQFTDVESPAAAASRALYMHDIDGVKVPLGKDEDGTELANYVSFSDEHLRVDHVYVLNPETLRFEQVEDPNEERRDHIKVWSGAGQAYDHPDILFIGSGTGGQNEGYGLYASGVLGVARDKYARAYIPKNPKTWAQLPVNGDRRYKTLGEFGKKCKTWAMKGSLNPEESINIYFAALANDAVSGKIPKGNVKEALKKAILEELERKGKAVEEYMAWGRAVMNHEQVEKKTRRQEMAEAREAQLYKTYLALGFNQESVLEEQLDALLDVPVHRPAVMEQTWFTNRPEGDVSHLLSWFEPVTDEQRKWVEEAFDKRFADFDGYDYWKERIFKPGIIGKDFYKELHDLFLNIAHSSGMPTTDLVVQGHLVEFLLDADIDGTRYPVDYRHGHMKGELGWNYVAFSDEFLRVDHVYEYNPETDDFERKWHESEVGASLRFTETPLGQELVAKAFDAIVGSRVDLLLRPSRYYGNPYETAKRNPRDGLVVEKLGREIDVSEPKGFAAEVSAEISRFGTREGDPTLREIRARCGSKARFYEVLGAVYETAEAVRSGLADVVTGRERAMMENAGLQAADFIKHNATARATALGRKLYLMGREFAWKLYQEDIAAARAEVERQRRKASEARGETRAAKAQTRNAERREETARNQAYQNRWGLAEERFMREYERALLRHQAARKVSDVREQMQEQVDLLRLREAKKRALERERGVTFTALKATLGVDIPARLRALAGTQEDPFEAAAKLIVEIDDGFDKWVKRDRRDLLDGEEPYTYLKEQGERAYAETMGNVLKAVARDLSYGKLREALLNAADKIARAKPETVRVIAEGKLGRVARVLRLAQNADIVTLARRRIKSALAEANKRLSSANSGMRTRYMTAMRKQAKELIKTMQLAVSAQDNTKASEKKRYAMLAERARLAEELKVIESGKTPDDLAKDETLTDRQHQDAVKLMFLEKFGDLSYTIDPAEVWAKAAEAEGFVVS